MLKGRTFFAGLGSAAVVSTVATSTAKQQVAARKIKECGKERSMFDFRKERSERFRGLISHYRKLRSVAPRVNALDQMVRIKMERIRSQRLMRLMAERLRPLVPLLLVTALPIVPFLLFGEPIERYFAAWREHPPAALIVAGAVIGLLASDVLLPVPSSVVCTLAGAQLGWLGGTVINWIGMTLGALVAFAIAKKWGPAVASWFSTPEQLARTEVLVNRYGPGVLMLTRGLPVLAEAGLLWLGMNGLSWRAMLLPMMISHLVLALVYALLGHFAGSQEWLPIALTVAAAVPVLALAFVPSLPKSTSSADASKK
jgi:uncharacterized membrane protein YdjX (TVP38/TMEM64 family)